MKITKKKLEILKNTLNPSQRKYSLPASGPQADMHVDRQHVLATCFLLLIIGCAECGGGGHIGGKPPLGYSTWNYFPYKATHSPV